MGLSLLHCFYPTSTHSNDKPVLARAPSSICLNVVSPRSDRIMIAYDRDRHDFVPPSGDRKCTITLEEEGKLARAPSSSQ